MRAGSRFVACVAALVLPTSIATAAVTYTELYTMGTPPGTVSPHASSAAGGQVVGTAIRAGGGGAFRAVMWTPTNPGGIDLTQFNWYEAQGFGTNGSQQVGQVRFTGTGFVHAMLWNGSAASAVSLDPGYIQSTANAIHGNRQVGEAFTSNGNFVAVWSGTAASAVLLTSSTFLEVHGQDISVIGDRVAGFGREDPNANNFHALLWDDLNAAPTDLHPAAGYFESRLQAISDDGAQQVGISRVGNLTPFHAMLWNGTAASATDLHPAGSAFSDTIAYATDGTHQVGYGDIAQGFAPHALLWSGSAASVFDLQSVLPANFVYSQASSINGNLIYGWAQDVNSNYHAIVWTIPEPASAALFICFAVTLLVRHRVRISAPAESGVGYRGTPL